MREVRWATNYFFWGGMWGTLALISIPLLFFLDGEDRLRMTNDYAAITAGISVTLLLICIVELHLAASRAKKRVEDVTSSSLDHDVFTAQSEVVSEFFFPLAWLAACIALSCSLLLTGLWAAIENHGPARWVAWMTLVSNAFGLLTLVAAYANRAMNEIVRAMARLVVHGATNSDETASSEEDSPVPDS
ncbi:hypothetical protein SAM9427_37240 (plasmid) [Streptomyces sp. ETH9427]|nr:hypothetical protein SAM9427_37240 [Streptomyces sp. ETH9427]